MTTAPFDPWRAAEHHDDLILAAHPLARLMGGGFYAQLGSTSIIVVDPDLDGAERRVVLTHELVHHERGGSVARTGAPERLQALVDREERAVDREVARRLVPDAELRTLVCEHLGAGDGLDVREVADHFEVPVAIASLALAALAGDRPIPR